MTEWIPFQYTKDDIPKHVLKVIDQDIGSLSKKSCGNCGVKEDKVKLMGCAGCRTSVVLKTFYCSRECQRKDWKIHKIDCALSHTVVDRLGYDCAKYHKKTIEERYYKLEALYGMLTWAASMAFQSNRDMSPHRLCLQFVFTEDKFDFDAPFIFIGIRFSQMKWEDFFNAKPKPISTNYLTCFQLCLDELQLPPHVEHVADGVVPEDKPYIPQWPWILKQISSIGGVSNQLYMTRLTVLRECLRISLDTPGNPLATFIPPKFEEEKLWKVARYKEWHSYTKDVVQF